MKVERRDGSQERQILIGMVVDSVVLGAIASKWERDIFQSRWSNLVGEWCVDFYRRYDRAPGKAVESLFEAWAARAKDNETVELVERFLGQLSSQYQALSEESNSEYLIDVASKHFRQVKIGKLKTQLEADLEAGDLEQAEKRLNGYSRIEMGKGSFIDVLGDHEAVKRSFASKGPPLITYPGALGNFFGRSLERDGFIGFEGPSKRGKTRWMLDIAFRGVTQKRKVAFFEVGDLSESQIMMRFNVRVSGRPLFKSEPGHPLRIPNYIEPGHPHANVTFDERYFKHDLDIAKAIKAREALVAKLGCTEPLLMLSCHPTGSISMHGVVSELQAAERTGWVPDIVVIDYADILAPMSGGKDSRDQINETWARMRRLSQELHCLVVTASQSDADSYKATTLGQINFSGDRRKNDHVTGMVGINVSDAERVLGITRLNWPVPKREEETPDGCINVAGCWAVANPAILSCF